MELEGRPHFTWQRLRLPHHLIEAFDATVQSVRAVVSHERILLVTESEFALRNPIPIAAD